MPLPSAGPHRSVVASGLPFSVTDAVTLMTYGLSGAIENVFCARSPASSAYSKCACQVPASLDGFEDSVNGAAASLPDTAGSSTPRVNGSAESAGA